MDKVEIDRDLLFSLIHFLKCAMYTNQIGEGSYKYAEKVLSESRQALNPNKGGSNEH